MKSIKICLWIIEISQEITILGFKRTQSICEIVVSIGKIVAVVVAAGVYDLC